MPGLRDIKIAVMVTAVIPRKPLAGKKAFHAKVISKAIPIFRSKTGPIALMTFGYLPRLV
ncbi:hypothetical protein ScFU29_08500 [Streptococcus canis]|nr:hypothetical protein ScFU29_08500 [Streptococcus canis]